MMVDEQFPLQRKILKGQVVVRNEETSVCARSEMNNNGVHFRLFLFFYSHVYYMTVRFVYILTRSNNGMHCRVKVANMSS